jgi:hypothetical protein
MILQIGIEFNENALKSTAMIGKKSTKTNVLPWLEAILRESKTRTTARKTWNGRACSFRYILSWPSTGFTSVYGGYRTRDLTCVAFF